jgi:hypothetical protein
MDTTRAAAQWLALLLASRCAIPIAAQQLDADNWGKNTSGVTLVA